MTGSKIGQIFFRALIVGVLVVILLKAAAWQNNAAGSQANFSVEQRSHNELWEGSSRH